MRPHHSSIKALGEVALRVMDLERMRRFYQDVIGLELLERFPHVAFFRIAKGYGGHTQVLALFDRSNTPGYDGVSAAKTTIDHFAFEIDRMDFEREKERLESLGLDVTTAEHQWVHWRSLYVRDPDGKHRRVRLL